MSLSDARMPSLKDKIEAEAERLEREQDSKKVVKKLSKKVKNDEK